MAVEARHLNSLHPQRDCNNRQLLSGIDENLKMYGTSVGHGGSLMPRLSEIATETFLPKYGTTVADCLPTKHSQPQTNSGIPCTLAPSRKRSRNSIHQLHRNQNHFNSNNFFTSFLGEDISLMIQYQQLEIDNFISQHVVKTRSEMEEYQRANRRRIIAAVEDIIVKKLRAKEEEMDKMVKINQALHEKVKSLSIENQTWRDLARSNEATVTTLRTNIQQVMRRQRARGTDNSQSCCSSNNNGGQEEADNNANSSGGNWCRKCGKVESCVLLLPCRHLCVCSVCGLGLNICPVCESTKNASLVVNKC